jgi:outer membrane protein OmpA-like peptidoglycan-associated protein
MSKGTHYLMKNNLLHTLFFSCFVLLSVLGQAQEKQLEKADQKYDRYAFIDAQKIYLKVAEEGYRSSQLFKRLGNSYYFNAEFEDAAKWYGELMKDATNEVESEYYFRYSQSLKALEKYDEADKWMMKFNTFSSKDDRAYLFTEQPDYLREINYNSGSYEITRTAINSPYSDFGTAFSEDKLVFASSRDTGAFIKRIYEWTGDPFLDLYEVTINPTNGELSKVNKYRGNLNSIFHESTPAFTKDGKTVYFTKNNYNDGSYREDEKGTNKLKLYKATRKSESKDFGTPLEMPFNSDEYSTGHPTLSPDEKKLFFSSDMPGSEGLSDIWVVDILSDESYSEPRNLGERINTAGRETFPFMTETGDLYFASDGHIGLGGLDIFVTNVSDAETITQIINIGEPANSSRDDFAFVIDEDTKFGYLSSNRNGGLGEDDIYRFKQLKEHKIYCEVIVTGVVVDKDTGELIPGATVSLVDGNNNIIKSLTVGDRANYAFVTECETQYFLRAIKADYIGDEKLFTTPTESQMVELDLQLEKEIVKAEVGDDIGKLLKLEPIYFDFDKHNIRPDAAVELAKVIAVMNEYPQMKIDVRSHTDSRGKDDYNMRLSERRNKSTINYIVERGGISRDRLTGRGYGESELINECANGIPCSREKHELNRRSEFRIVQISEE